MRLSFNTYKLFFKEPFKISHGTYTFRENVIVSMQEGNEIGLGEASAIDYYGQSISSFEHKLTNIKEEVEELSLKNPGAWWKQLFAICQKDYFVCAAIDCALWDLYARLQRKSLIRLWNLNPHHLPTSNYTLSIGAEKALIRQIKALNWPIYKLKLGQDADLSALIKIREMTNSKIRLDINGAWNIDQLNEYEPFLRQLDVEYIEQPLKPGLDTDLKEYKGQIPIIADESCQKVEDIHHCATYYNGINIKLMKCGGITKALDMIKIARKHKLMVMGGCMTETSVGMSCLAQLSPYFDFIDLDGSSLIRNDPASGVSLSKGVIHLPKGYGTGSFLK